jgi:hypothetical protein
MVVTGVFFLHAFQEFPLQAGGGSNFQLLLLSLLAPDPSGPDW